MGYSWSSRGMQAPSRNQRRADEYITKAIRICAVLIEMDPSKIPLWLSWLSWSLWARRIQANRGMWWTRSTALSAESSTTSCLSARHSHTTRPTTELPRMFVITCMQHEVEFWLNVVSWLFVGTNTLIILHDCAASKDVKGRTGQLVNLGFSARHIGISVWVLTQKITSITPSFRENVAAIVLFYTPSAKTTKAIFDDYAGELFPR